VRVSQKSESCSLRQQQQQRRRFRLKVKAPALAAKIYHSWLKAIFSFKILVNFFVSHSTCGGLAARACVSVYIYDQLYAKTRTQPVDRFFSVLIIDLLLHHCVQTNFARHIRTRRFTRMQRLNYIFALITEFWQFGSHQSLWNYTLMWHGYFFSHSDRVYHLRNSLPIEKGW
jgi:hypothetical protein